MTQIILEKKVAVDGPVVNAKASLASSTFSPGQALPAGPLGSWPSDGRWRRSVIGPASFATQLLRDEPVATSVCVKSGRRYFVSGSEQLA